MLFQGKDGEFRIYSNGFKYGSEPSGTTYYFEVLFTEMDFTGPIGRARTEETLIMNRGKMDTDSHYIEGNDDPRYAVMPFSFSCKLADTVNTRILSDWLYGVSRITNAVGGATQIYTWDGTTALDGNSLPGFKDAQKMAYRTEILWDGTSDYGLRYEEVHFPPGEQSITESADGITLSANGQIRGDVTRIASLYSGASILAFI